MKQLLYIILFMVTVLSVSAQRFDGGILGGLNASQVEGDFSTGYHKPGVVLGGFVQTDLSRKVYAGMEIKYAQKGSRENPEENDVELKKYIMRLGYMEVPAYLGYRTSENVSFFTGISAGYLMHSGEWDNYGLFQEEDQRPFNNFDFQALIGGRLDLNDRLTFDLRVAYSFLPMRDLPGDIYWYWWDDQYNNVISTCLYYRFGKK